MDERVNEQALMEAEELRPVPPWLAVLVGLTSLALLALVGAFFLAARGKELKAAHHAVVVAGTLVFALLGMAGLGISLVEAGGWFSRRWRRGKA